MNKEYMEEAMDENMKDVNKLEWDDKMQEDYPFMRRERYKYSPSPYYNFGVECRRGWSQIIKEACDAITERYAEDGIEPEEIDFIPTQIKEKFGTLRFYYEFLDTSGEITAFDNLNTGVSLRVKPKTEGVDERTKKLRDDIDRIVEEAERKSESVCECCGASGVLRDDWDEGIFWLSTLCDFCHKKRIETIIERKSKPKLGISEFLE